MKVKKGQHRFYIKIVRELNSHTNDRKLETVFIGAITEQEMPYQFTRGVSSDGELTCEYEIYRTSLTIVYTPNEGHAKCAEAPSEIFPGKKGDIVTCFDMKIAKRKGRNFRVKKSDGSIILINQQLLQMFDNGKKHWCKKEKEREEKLKKILND